MSTFQRSPRLLFTSESVTGGHPDKVCDQISDAILDWCLTQEPQARVACEAAIKSDGRRHWVSVFGETTPRPPTDVVQNLVRKTLREIGYTDPACGFDVDQAEIEVLLSGQAPDIARGVDRALEARQGELPDDLDTGAGDQGMMIGFACDETPEYMPAPIVIAHHLTRHLAAVRKAGLLPWLRPDGKCQVTVEYHDGVPFRVHTMVLSAQHAPCVEQAELAWKIRELVIDPVLEEMERAIGRPLRDEDTRSLVKPTGHFIEGGALADAGITGRKVIVDTYGGMAQHGGGAFSGKDPTKVDRSGAYAARWVAKNVVAAGLATKCEVQVAYAIGKAEPVGLFIETLDLRRPIYRESARHGHFGRELPAFTWERTDKAAALRKEVGMAAAAV